MNKDRRCKKCNWLNKEVLEDFICTNCGESNFRSIKNIKLKDSERR